MASNVVCDTMIKLASTENSDDSDYDENVDCVVPLLEDHTPGLRPATSGGADASMGFSETRCPKDVVHTHPLLGGLSLTLGPRPQAPRRSLTLDERIRVIELFDAGMSARKIADDFGVGKTQIQNTLKRKEEYLTDFANSVSGNSKRRARKSPNDQINDICMEWFRECTAEGLHVTGPMVKEKALQLAGHCGIKDFKASNGWLYSFLKRAGMHSGPLRGMQKTYSSLTAPHEYGMKRHLDPDGGSRENIETNSKLFRLNNHSPGNDATDVANKTGYSPVYLVGSANSFGGPMQSTVSVPSPVKWKKEVEESCHVNSCRSPLQPSCIAAKTVDTECTMHKDTLTTQDVLDVAAESLHTDYTSREQHADMLLGKMYQMWQDGNLVDLLLDINGITARVHKLVVMGVSPYACLLLSEMQNENANCLKMQVPCPVHPSSVAALVLYLYTGHLVLNNQTVVAMECIASAMCMTQLQQLCLTYLDNCKYHTSSCSFSDLSTSAHLAGSQSMTCEQTESIAHDMNTSKGCTADSECTGVPCQSAADMVENKDPGKDKRSDKLPLTGSARRKSRKLLMVSHGRASDSSHIHEEGTLGSYTDSGDPEYAVIQLQSSASENSIDPQKNHKLYGKEQKAHTSELSKSRNYKHECLAVMEKEGT